MSLNPKNFGLAGGILVSLTLFGTVWHAILTNLGYECLKENSKFRYFYQNSFWFQIIKRNIVVEMPKYSVMEPGMSSGGKGGKIIFWLGVGSAIIFAIVVLLGTVGKDIILTPGI